MSDELKNKIDTFVKNIIIKFGNKKEDIPEIQKDYDELIEYFEKFTILTNEDYNSLDKAMNKYDSSIKDLQAQINILQMEKEANENQIKSLMKEVEDNKDLKEKYNKLNDEYNSIKIKRDCFYKENIDFQMKKKLNEKLINELQNEINNLKKENFEKFERIIVLEKNNKLNEIKLGETIEKLTKYTIENNDLAKLNIELRNNSLDQKKEYQSKLLVLERQVKHLSDANINFVQENNEVQTQLKDLQMYTNMAKASTKKLNKEDFSILETMSIRAERAETEVQKLRTNVNELKTINEKLTKKIIPLENYIFLQMKHDHEINIENDTLFNLQNKIFTEEEKIEINKLKNRPNELMQTLIKLKTENLELHNQIKDITIECNQQLREAKSKK
jgi:chromosome segregation ATPase